MTEDEQKIKKERQQHHDRVSLDEKSLERLDGWVKQVTSDAKGVALSRKDLANWLIQRHEPSLSREETKELVGIHFNELRFLQQTIRDLKNARSRGETVDLKELLNHEVPTPEKRRKRTRLPTIVSGEDDKIRDFIHQEFHDDKEIFGEPNSAGNIDHLKDAINIV